MVKKLIKKSEEQEKSFKEQAKILEKLSRDQ